ARLGWAGLAAASAVAVLLSGSASGSLALLVGLGAFGGLSVFLLWKKLAPRVRKRASTVFAVAAGLAFLVLAVNSGGVARYFGKQLASTGEAGHLPRLWEAGAKQFAETPMSGAGSRSSYIYTRLFRSEKLNSPDAEPE